MDDSAQSPTQDDTKQAIPQDPADQVQPQTQPAQQPEPVSLPHKEFVPRTQVSEASSLEQSMVEPEIAPEVAEAGVEVTPVQHTPKIHPDAAKAGLSPAKEATPVITTPTGIIKLPMTEEEAKEVRKVYGIKDSMRWRAELVLEQLKKIYRKLVN